MIIPNFAVYKGQESEKDFVSFFAEKNFFAIIKINNFSKEKGEEILKKINSDLEKSQIEKLTDFELIIDKHIKEGNFPISFSLACGFRKENLFYLKTIGDGEIYLRRDHQIASIIRNNNSASGFIKNKDFFIFSTKELFEILGEEVELKKIFDERKPNEALEKISPKIKEKGDLGSIALFLLFEEKKEFVLEKGIEKEAFEKKEEVELGEKSFLPFYSFKEKISGLDWNDRLRNKNKRLTLIVVIIIFIVLIWSVVFGWARRRLAIINKEINNTKELISHKLKEAEDVSFLNLNRSLDLIKESKDELKTLEKKLGKENRQKIEEIENLIKKQEQKLLKKEEKPYEEFFDLAIENKETEGSLLSLSEENLAILDKKGTIYLLSLSKKSISKKTFSEIKEADLLALYEDQILFYKKNQGIYKIINNKLNKVIDNDNEWGNLIDFKIYNGNLYLLDKDKDEIYKYLVSEDGYSNKTSYFKTGQAVDLTEANSLAIDLSIYIGFNDRILKYTAGVKDDFKTEFPNSSPKINKIFTDKNTEKILALDKNKATIYILAKTGAYERQIYSPILAQASDFVVFNNQIYFLAGQKIYKLALN